jgi:hypothetical protein
MLTDAQRKIPASFSDDLVYALASYILSLEPPSNPNPKDARSEAGRRIFAREGCGGCHTPPLYTNNKLTLAAGYTPPKGHPLHADIMPVSVRTDARLALETRKGTGLYKVPSLKGVWYRGPFGHDGSVAMLEDWFDPARLRDDYVPTGFKGYKVERRAVPGHEFGLKLPAEEKAALIAFLRTLYRAVASAHVPAGDVALRQRSARAAFHASQADDIPSMSAVTIAVANVVNGIESVCLSPRMKSP